MNLTSAAAEALEQNGVTRRGLLRAAGALVVGYSMTGGGTKKAAAQTTLPFPPVPLNQVDSWVAVMPDETILAYSGRCDFGQGFKTVQYQLVAEELQIPLERINMLICDTAITPDQGTSSGSQGHPVEFGPSALRQALATAREALTAMAAEELKVPASELDMNNGVFTVRSDRTRSVTFGKLVAGKRFNLTINPRATPRHPSTYKYLGKSYYRYDVAPKVTGEFEYVHHVRVPGMLHGKVVRPPTVGAKVVSVDESSVRGLPGNVKVVVKNDFVGVVADKEWYALKAAEALKVTWSDSPTLPPFETFYDYMKAQPSRDAYIVLANDVDDKLKAATRVISATYLHPYQAHGSLGTSCAVADIKGTGPNASGTIWSATQGVYPQRDSVARVLDIPNTRLRVIFLEGSGCYGINGADTVSYDAALLSQGVGAPVRVQLTRKDELTGADHFGPAYVISMKAGIDSSGEISVWDSESWAASKGGRPNAANPGNIPTGALAGIATAPIVPARATPPTAFNNGSNAVWSYGSGCVGNTCGGTGKIKSERALVHTIQSPFFTGPLRSPARLQNTFAHESFMDEIAAALRQDPVAYRARHLTDHRLSDVLTGAARAYGWDTRPSPKPGNARTGVVTGRGIAICLYEGDNGYCGLVVEAEVNQDTGAITLKRVVASGDSGPISNPDGLRNQMEGGALQGLGRALLEEVRWNDKSLMNVDWRSYRSFAFGMAIPKVECVLIDRPNEEHMGAGETSITIAAAALGNAIFDATGARLRQLPFTPARVLEALRARPTA